MKNVADIYPLTPAQAGMLFHTLEVPGSRAYFSQYVCTLSGQMDVAAFRKAWHTVVARHPVLRTAFIWEGIDEPLQVVRQTVELPFAHEDWRESDPAEHRNQLENFLRLDRVRGFDLAKAPLSRLALFQVETNIHQMVWSQHHLQSDGWSTGLILKEVFDCYETLHRGETPKSGAPRAFKDYVGWLQKQDIHKAETFWKKELAGFTTPVDLWVGRDVSAKKLTGSYEQCQAKLSESVTSTLRQFAQQHRLTLNTIIQGAWAILLSRYSGERDVLFGSTVSGRPTDLPGVESMIGMFINTLPTRIQIEPNAKLLPWLKNIQNRQLEVRRYEYSPLVKIQAWSDAPKGQSLFETIVVFENYPIDSSAFQNGNPSLRVDNVRYLEQSNYTLSLLVMPGRQLRLLLIYNDSYFDEDVIARLLGHLETLLSGIATNPIQLIGDLPLLTPNEQHQLRNTWNNTGLDYPRPPLIQRYIEQHAAQNPETVAVVDNVDQLTYQELNLRANQLAHYLRKLDVKANTTVGLVLERSIDMIIAILAVLKAGGAYLPLDPTHPQERLAFMLADTQAPVILTRQKLAGSLSEYPANTVFIDSDWDVIAREDRTAPQIAAEPENLAYVIFTSGSTGDPKGVPVSHQNLVHSTSARFHFYEKSVDRFLLLSPFTFDSSMVGIFWTLCQGGTLVLPQHRVEQDILQLAAIIAKYQISHLLTLPSLYALLLEQADAKQLVSLRNVIVAGEECRGGLVDRHYTRLPQAALFNEYGPTEGTVWSTAYKIPANFEGDRVPIGRPIPNMHNYIFDCHGHLAPVGVPGELCIGGIGVTSGYLNRPELTAEKFIEHSFTGELSIHLYRTGDLARYLPDGNIEFLGRMDHQVKIRGYRIELREVETTLYLHPSVSEAVVVAREDRPGDKRLVAYVVAAAAESAPSTGVLHAFLQDKLPDYMIPSAFVSMDAMPLTAHGKVDRRALPAPDRMRPDLEEVFLAPRTQTEELVAGIWSDVLGLECIGVYDSFFDLGGHSLLAIKIVSRLKTTFTVDIPLRAFLDSPTIAGVSAAIAMARRGEKPTEKTGILPVARNGTLPLSFAQERFWVLDQFHTNRAVFNGLRGFRLRGPFQLEVFRESVQALVDRHEILRTTFASVGGEPHQVIAPTLSVEVLLQNCSDLSKEERAGMIQQAFLEEGRFQFDLAHGPLFHVRLLRFAEDDHFLVLNFHHIILDAWSLEVIFKDLVTAYTAGCTGHAVTLPALPIQYADYAHWQRELLEGPIGRDQLAFWKTQLGQLPPALPLPTDYARPAVQTFRGARESLQLSAELLAPLRVLNRQEGTTLFMVLLTTLQLLLHRLTGTHDILVGSLIAGRDQQELHGLIGCFLNTLVLRTDLSGDPTGRELLQRVREVVLNAYENQDIPFEKVLAEVNPVRDLSRTPIFQVMLNMHSFDDQHLPLPELSVTQVYSTDINSLFDMTLYFIESTDEIHLNLVYNTDLFDASTITWMLAHFETLLEGITDDPDRCISALPLLTGATRQKLSTKGNTIQPTNSFANFQAAEIDQSLQDRFMQQVYSYPDNIAVKTRNYEWTYQELNLEANRIAKRILTECGDKEERIALLFGHDAPMIASLIGALKAGKTYVPLDPSYPLERLIYILEDSNACAVLTDSINVDLGEALTRKKVQLINIDDKQSAQAFENVDVSITPYALAYILYTSGSTGLPKGVMQNHRNVMHFIRVYTNNLHISEDDRLSLISSYTFDGAIMDIFGALLNGSTLYPINIKEETPESILQWLIDQEITLYHSTPTVYRYLLSSLDIQKKFPKIRLVVLGGEEVFHQDVELYKKHFEPDCIFINGLGPSESTVTLQYLINGDTEISRTAVPAGYPVEETEILLLNDVGEETEVYGEISIRSPHIALGYWQKPELTNKAFLPDPEGGNKRIYRSGDMGRLLSDGSIEFAGRKDFQVKIRGFRIEIGEIEVVLGQHPAVGEVVVVPAEDSHGDRQLVAYLVINENPSPSIFEIRSFLKQKLPEYMIPSAFEFLDALPRTPNGKVDQRALPAPDVVRPDLQETFVAPRSQSEELVAGIWSNVLGIERIGVHDNFFELGGHSLLATRVVAWIRQEIEVDLKLMDFFIMPTIAELTKGIEGLLWIDTGIPGDDEAELQDGEEWVI